MLGKPETFDFLTSLSILLSVIWWRMKFISCLIVHCTKKKKYGKYIVRQAIYKKEKKAETFDYLTNLSILLIVTWWRMKFISYLIVQCMKKNNQRKILLKKRFITKEFHANFKPCTYTFVEILCEKIHL